MTSPVVLKVGYANDGGVTTFRTPWTLLPTPAVGLMLTVTVALLPGWMVTGVPRSAVGSSTTAQKSPVEDVTAASKSGVRAVRSTWESAVGGGVLPTGTTSLTSVNQPPVETVPCFSFTVALETVLPFLPSARLPT